MELYNPEIIDDRVKPFMFSACRFCKHFNGIESGTCLAYPNGIPEKFSSEGERHNKINNDQIGDFICVFR
jgi:hypothetical protein